MQFRDNDMLQDINSAAGHLQLDCKQAGLFFFLGLDLGDFGTEMREEHELLTRALLAGTRDHAVDYLGKQIERSKERILKALVTQRADITIG